MASPHLIAARPPHPSPQSLKRKCAPSRVWGACVNQGRRGQETASDALSQIVSHQSDWVGLSKPKGHRLAAVNLCVGRGILCVNGAWMVTGSANAPNRSTGVKEPQSPDPDLSRRCLSPCPVEGPEAGGCSLARNPNRADLPPHSAQERAASAGRPPRSPPRRPLPGLPFRPLRGGAGPLASDPVSFHRFGGPPLPVDASGPRLARGDGAAA